MLYRVAKTADFEDLKPIYVEIGNLTVAVFKHREKYYAYANICPHQGGPSCEGIVVGNVESEVKDGTRRDFVSTENLNITCPWHGIEFDLESGVCRALKDWRLASFQTVVEGDSVLIERN